MKNPRCDGAHLGLYFLRGQLIDSLLLTIDACRRLPSPAVLAGARARVPVLAVAAAAHLAALRTLPFKARLQSTDMRQKWETAIGLTTIVLCAGLKPRAPNTCLINQLCPRPSLQVLPWADLGSTVLCSSAIASSSSAAIPALPRTIDEEHGKVGGFVVDVVQLRIATMQP